MHLPGTACPEATEIMQRMWTDGVSRLDWVSAEDQNEVNLRNELQRGFTTPSLAHTAAALSKNGHGRAKVTVLDPTIGTGVLAASIVIRLAELPAAERPKWINVIGIDRNLKYCKAARTCLADLAGWAVNRGILVDTHVVTGDFLNPASWTGDIRGRSHEEINADIVVINPPHRPVRSKTREGNRIKEFKLLPSSTTEAAYIELATRAIADGGELIALSSARWMTDEDNSRAVRRLQKAGSITDIHLYRRQNISCSRLFGRNAQHLDATAWRYQKGTVGLPATSVFHETTGPDEPHGATIRVVTPHEMVLPTTGGNQHRQAIEIPRSRLDDEIQRILRNLPKLKNTGLHIARGRLSPYRERQRFTQDAGNEPVALITANNIVQAQSAVGTTWKLQWPSQRPNSLNYYRADRDSAPMNPIQPGSYVLITGPAGNAKEPCHTGGTSQCGTNGHAVRGHPADARHRHEGAGRAGTRDRAARRRACARTRDLAQQPPHPKPLPHELEVRHRDGASGNAHSDAGQRTPAGDRTTRNDRVRRSANRAPNPADERRGAGARRQRIDRAGLGGASPEARRRTEDRELRRVVGDRGNCRAPGRGSRRSRRRRHPAAD